KYERGRLNPSLGKVKEIAKVLDIDYSILAPIESIEELDLAETKFEFFIGTHCKGFMYDKAPEEVQNKIRNLFTQCEVIDGLVEEKQVEKEFDNPTMIASIFYDYISRKKVEYEEKINDRDDRIKRYEDMIDKLLLNK
ncbi:MAG: helix-turn-helix transcriptional regulator, partial [Romboutsia sp.]